MAQHSCSAWLTEAHKNASCLECQRQEHVTCTCPDWWFPPDRREKLRTLAHGFGGILQHHSSCEKAR
jgi:hypothetical protein